MSDIDRCLSEVSTAIAKKKSGCYVGPAKAKPMVKPKAKKKDVVKLTVKAKETGTSKIQDDRKSPLMPALKKVDPIYYRGCRIYSSEKNRPWRVVAASNPRYDKKFNWAKGEEGKVAWKAVLKWCLENGE